MRRIYSKKRIKGGKKAGKKEKVTGFGGVECKVAQIIRFTSNQFPHSFHGHW